MEMPQGNSAACGSQPLRFLCQVNPLTGVPFVKNSPRAPLGPSDVLIDGIPLPGIGMVRQKSAPASNEIW
jgi:hypothetical protein